jgi:hypothetical protein
MPEYGEADASALTGKAGKAGKAGWENSYVIPSAPEGTSYGRSEGSQASETTGA